MIWMFAALCVAVVGLMIYLILTQFGGSSQPVQEESVVASLPDGEVQQMTGSKSEAFRGSISTDAYFDMLSGEVPADEDVSLVSDSLKAKQPSAPTPVPSGSAVERVFGAPDSPAPSETPKRSSGGGSAARPMSSQERLEYDRQRAEMVRDVLSGGNSVNEETPVTEDAPESPMSIDLSAVGTSDGIISSLDDEPSEGVSYSDGGLRPFRCMFVRDQKLTSGQRVTLRLLEDYNQDGVRIPLALDAYDTDGLQGIYCPETSTAKNARKASDDAISTAGQTFGGLVGDIASTVIRTGASIAKSASGELSVSVVSGYEFYLVKSERK